MGIQSIMEQLCRQTAVYWAYSEPDGYGGSVYALPVELKCRWEEVTENITRSNGDQIISKAVVYLLQDVVQDGVLFLGSLSDLTMPQKANPKLKENTYIIARFDKTPSLRSSTEFLRKAYL